MPRRPWQLKTGFEVFASKVKTNVESLVGFATGVNTDGPGGRVYVDFTCNYKVAKGTKNVTVKIKRGGGEGPVIGEWVKVTVTAETVANLSFSCIDNAVNEVAEIGNAAQYSVTFTTEGAEAEGEVPFSNTTATY